MAAPGTSHLADTGVLVPSALPLFARPVVESQQHRFIDPPSCAHERRSSLTRSTEVVNGFDGWVGFPGFAIRRADQRDARTALRQVCEYPAVEDLVVEMSERDEN
jgi:hypothetical protein